MRRFCQDIACLVCKFGLYQRLCIQDEEGSWLHHTALLLPIALSVQTTCNSLPILISSQPVRLCCSIPLQGLLEDLHADQDDDELLQGLDWSALSANTDFSKGLDKELPGQDMLAFNPRF